MQKYDANDITKSGITNDPHGSRHLYMDNKYAALQLFALMVCNYNMILMGKGRANRKVFETENLILD